MKRLNENEIIKKLKTVDIPQLKISIKEFVSPNKRFQTGSTPDLFIDVVWCNETWNFDSVIKTVATPKLIAAAVSQLDMFRQASESGPCPMIVAPYLSRAQFQELATRNISAIDLSGNVMLIVPGKLFIERIGNPNLFPSNSPIKNIYRGASSVVGRVILSRNEYASVGAVFEETKKRGAKITLGTVSKVLKELDDDFIISRKEGIQLLDAESLLDKLKSNYVEPVGTEMVIGKVAGVQKALRKIGLNCKKEDQRYAVTEPQRYLVSPTAGEPIKIYVENIPDALKEIDFEETDRFPNISLVETNDEPVYFDREWDPKSKQYFVSPLQTYLELSQKGKREQDAAPQLREGILAGGRDES